MGWLSSLFKAFAAIFDFLKDKRIEDGGRAKERVATTTKALENVQKAKDAVAAPRPDDVERMRDKWDRDRQ